MHTKYSVSTITHLGCRGGWVGKRPFSSCIWKKSVLIYLHVLHVLQADFGVVFRSCGGVIRGRSGIHFFGVFGGSDVFVLRSCRPDATPSPPAVVATPPSLAVCCFLCSWAALATAPPMVVASFPALTLGSRDPARAGRREGGGRVGEMVEGKGR